MTNPADQMKAAMIGGDLGNRFLALKQKRRKLKQEVYELAKEESAFDGAWESAELGLLRLEIEEIDLEIEALRQLSKGVA